MNIGDKFPEVLGLDADNKQVKLSDFPGKKFIIYFYPKDSTSGCTIEAKNLRDNYDTFQKMGYQIIGVSKDSATSHKKFAENNGLPFPLVSDKDGELCMHAGVWQKKKMMGKEYMGIVRTTFVCDHDGTVTDIIEKVIPKIASDQLFNLLEGRYDINPA